MHETYIYCTINNMTVCFSFMLTIDILGTQQMLVKIKVYYKTLHLLSNVSSISVLLILLSIVTFISLLSIFFLLK